MSAESDEPTTDELIAELPPADDEIELPDFTRRRSQTDPDLPYDFNGKDKAKKGRHAKPGPAPKFDWPLIRLQYESGRFTMQALARSHKVSARMIYKRATAEAWAVGQTAVLIARRARQEAALQGDQADRILAIDTAIAANVRIIRDHQSVIGKGRLLTQRLLDELTEEMDKLATIEELAKLATESVQEKGAARALADALSKRLSIANRVQTLKDMAVTAKTWIELERQAFELDADKGADNPEQWSDDRLNARLAHLLRSAGVTDARPEAGDDPASGSEADEEPEA